MDVARPTYETTERSGFHGKSKNERTSTTVPARKNLPTKGFRCEASIQPSILKNPAGKLEFVDVDVHKDLTRNAEIKCGN